MDITPFPDLFDKVEISDFDDELSKICFKDPENVFAAFILLLVVIGLFGNICIIVTILTLQEYKKSVANWYILQLALADTLFLITLPFEAISEIKGSWIYPDWLCLVKQAVLFINYYASIYFLMVMSFDRYLAVTKAFAFTTWVKVLRSSTSSYVITVIGWCLSISACIPLYLYSDVEQCPRTCAHKFPLKETFCNLPENINSTECRFELLNKIPTFEYYNDLFNNNFGNNDTYAFEFPTNYNDTYNEINYEKSLNTSVKNTTYFSFDNESYLYNDYDDDYDLSKPIDILNAYMNNEGVEVRAHCKYPESTELEIWIYSNFIGAFCLPFFIICFFYGMIIKTILETGTISGSDSQRSYRKRVTLIVLALVSLFAISWLPWHVVNICKLYGFYLPGADDCKILDQAVRVVAYVNSALNPYFYSFLGVKFKERIARVGSRLSGVFNNSSYRQSTRNEGRRRSNSNQRSDVEKKVNPVVRLLDKGWWKKSEVKSKITVEEIAEDDLNKSTLQRTERTII